MRVGLLIVGLIGGAVVVAGAAIALVGRSINQPIEFNHNLHIKKAGIECTDCHLYAIKGVRATIPNIEICADCHQEPQTESVQEARLLEYIRDGRRIPWRKIHRVPDHVYFSHRRHTSIAGIEGETCHGNVEEQTRSFTRPLRKLSMDRCLECHERNEASTDCVACHQ